MKRPKYKQIIEYIKEKIGNGEWPIGSKIPSQRTLARQFNVNRSTVITALEELAADGLIEGRMGKGTVVVSNTWTLLANRSSPDWGKYVAAGFQQPSRKTVQEINQSESNPALVQLSKGELSKDMFPLSVMKEMMGKVAHRLEAFGYEEPKGYLPLREALSRYLRTIGIQASPASILIVSGALQALQLISMGILQSGSTVFLDRPSYLYSLHVFQSAGMKLSGLQNRPAPRSRSDHLRQKPGFIHPGISGIFTSVLPVSAVVLSGLVLKEQFTVIHLIGIMLVIAVIFVTVIMKEDSQNLAS